LLAAALVLGLGLGLGADVVRVGGLDTWLVHRGLSPPYDAKGRLVQVDGRDVYLDCRGAGSPTVILEAGFGTGAGSWGYVPDRVAGFTRVCAWDRPGIGRSERIELHSGSRTAAILRDALSAAGERGPFVVAGHSLGGVYARLFAATPGSAGATTGADAVLAFVMIDTYEPDLGMAADPVLAEDQRAMIQESIDSTGAAIQAGEALDWQATLAELARLGPVRQPGVTLWVEQRFRYHDPDPAREAALIEAWNRAVAARYPNAAIEIVPGAGHLIHLERPDLVVERIRDVVAAERP
jgi:pimeloyl-ACP methyl ester carboxylesterase